MKLYMHYQYSNEMQIDENVQSYAFLSFVGYLTRYAIESPACVTWRGLQVELRAIKNNAKMNPGQSFLFLFVEVLI